METWIQSVVDSGMPMTFGVLGALIAYAIGARVGLRGSFRVALGIAAFAGLFVVTGGSTPRLRNQSRAENATGDEEAVPPLWKYAGVASDETGSDIAGFFEDALHDLRGDSVVCANFLYGVLHSRVPPELSLLLDIRFRKLAARVIDEGQRSPQPRMDTVSAVALGKLMAARLRQSHGERRAREILIVMSNPANGLAKPRAVCDAATAVYSAIADMPPSQGGKLMRHMIDKHAVAPARAPHFRP